MRTTPLGTVGHGQARWAGYKIGSEGLYIEPADRPKDRSLILLRRPHVTIVSIQAVAITLGLAMLVTTAATARRLVIQFGRMMAVSVGLVWRTPDFRVPPPRRRQVNRTEMRVLGAESFVGPRT